MASRPAVHCRFFRATVSLIAAVLIGGCGDEPNATSRIEPGPSLTKEAPNQVAPSEVAAPTRQRAPTVSVQKVANDKRGSDALTEADASKQPAKPPSSADAVASGKSEPQ